MHDPVAQLETARREFERRLRLVRDQHWALPTPCAGWDVAALVNHVIGGCRRYTMLLHGATAEAVDATRTEDHLRGRALRSFRHAAATVAAAFGEPDALSRVVDHPSGARTGETLLVMRITEFAIHGWDLARAIAADDRLDLSLVDWLWEQLAEHDVIVDRRKYAAPPGQLPGSVSPQDRLLHLLGRAPDGQPPTSAVR